MIRASTELSPRIKMQEPSLSLQVLFFFFKHCTCHLYICNYNFPHDSFLPTAVPKIKTTDQNLVTDAGKPFLMTVPYDAYPRAEAEWFFNDISLPMQNIDTSTDKTENRLKDPKKSDQGRYKIVIKNKHGQGEAFINLDVIGELRLVNN